MKKRVKSEKDRKAWIAQMERYVFPELGRKPISEINTRTIINILEQFGWTKPIQLMS